MLGRKDYTQEELDAAKAAVKEQLSAYRKLAEACSDPEAKKALEAFEPILFNNFALSLDRRFVHRLRGVTGKEGTPLNELELVAESLMNNGGRLRGNNVVKYRPEESALKLALGDRIRIDATEFDRLSKGLFAELEEKYV